MNQAYTKLLEDIIDHHHNTAIKLKEGGFEKSVDYWYHCARAVTIRSQLDTINRPAPVKIKKIECDGFCVSQGDCFGKITRVEVFDWADMVDGELQTHNSWGKFNYCEHAVRTDKVKGFGVVDVATQTVL